MKSLIIEMLAAVLAMLELAQTCNHFRLDHPWVWWATILPAAICLYWSISCMVRLAALAESKIRERMEDDYE